MDKVKQKIQSLIPEIMELKFGCELIVLKDTKPYREWNTKVIDFVCDVIYYDDTETLGKCLRKDIKEILGRTITLANVLRAIDVHSQTNDIDVAKILYVLPDAPYQAMIVVGNIVNKWNLSDDNYDHQSQECKDLIGKLLGVN